MCVSVFLVASCGTVLLEVGNGENVLTGINRRHLSEYLHGLITYVYWLCSLRFSMRIWTSVESVLPSAGARF